MTSPESIVTRADHDRLQQCFDAVDESTERSCQRQPLREQLAGAIVVDPLEAPPGLVTMNSTVRLKDLESGSTRICRLVYPEAAFHSPAAISVFDPLGTSLIGCEVGDVVQCWELARRRRLCVDAILFQPERSGRFDL